MRVIPPNLAVLLGTALLFAACAERKDARLAECDMMSCPDECQNLAGPYCDVLDSACQKRIMAAVACVRGGVGELPRIRVVTEDELRAERDAGVDAGIDGGEPTDEDGGTPAAEPLDDYAYYGLGLQLLGLRASEMSTDTIDLLGGYYEPSQASITLVNRGEPQDSQGAQKTLAHELVHALQDQTVGLYEVNRATGSSTDARLALGCLVEGEARLYEELSWTLLNGLSVDRRYLDVSIARSLKYNRDGVVSAESPRDTAWILRYPVGFRYLLDAWLSGGNGAVQSMYDAPPTSTLYWMRGFAETQERAEPLIERLACNGSVTPKGFTPQWHDTLGAFVLFAFLGHAQEGVLPTETSWRRALAWRQDRLQVFSGPEGVISLSWRIRFADAATAKEVADELGTRRGLPVRVVRHGRELEVLASDSKQVLASLRSTNPNRCPVD